MANKKISELTVAGALTGTELVELVQGGVNKQTTAQDIADLGGGGTWGSITGTLSNQTDLYTYLRGTRTVDGVSNLASVQTDDNSLIIFNSATPFNFTLDQLTADSKISFVNIGAGAVTFIDGSGVTLVGSAVLPGAVNTDYPTALVFYISATTPRIVSGKNKIDLATASTAAGTITLDCNGQVERVFVGSASFSSSKTVALSNDTNALVIDFIFTITNVAGTIDFPSTFTMQTSDSRWNDASHRFTPSLTGKHEFNAVWDGTDWLLSVTSIYA